MTQTRRSFVQLVAAVLIVVCALMAAPASACAEEHHPAKQDVFVGDPANNLADKTIQGLVYDEAKGILTMSNYHGAGICIADLGSNGVVTVNLKGTNIIQEISKNIVNPAIWYQGTDGSLVVTSDTGASLTVNLAYTGSSFSDLAGIVSNGPLTIAGNATLNVNMVGANKGLRALSTVAGIGSYHSSCSITNSASVRVNLQAENARRCTGIICGTSVAVSTNKSLTVDCSGVKGCASSGYRGGDFYCWNTPCVTFVCDQINNRKKVPEVTGYRTVQNGMATSFMPERTLWVGLWGKDALSTMQHIVGCGAGNSYGNVFLETGGTVVVASDSSYKDALAITALAGLEDAPVLLTNSESLSKETRTELERLKPTKVYLAGGTMALSGMVESQIQDLQSKPTVIRAWGEDAALTAVDIYRQGKGSWGQDCIVATTSSYKDALSIAPYAYVNHAPIFLTDPWMMDAKTFSSIKNGGFKRIIVVGGPSAVSQEIERQLRTIQGTQVMRIGGVNGIETSSLIARRCLAEGMTVKHIGVARADGFKDALVGAALCGRNNSVMVLVDGSEHGDRAIRQTLTSDVVSTMELGYVFGGPTAIDDVTYALVASATDSAA